MSGLGKFGRPGRFGARGEELWRRWAKELGFAVFPMSWADRAGAPMFESLLSKDVAPDFMVCRNGLSTLVDVKAKSNCPRYVRGGRMQTGIEIRLHDAYWRVQEKTGLRVALLFIHADRTDVHLGYLDEITADAQFNRQFASADWVAAHPGHPFANKPMVFYNIDPNQGSRFRPLRIKHDLRDWMEFQRLSVPPRSTGPWPGRRHRPAPNQQSFEDWDWLSDPDEPALS